MRTDERRASQAGGESEGPRRKKRRHPALTFLGELPGLILMAFALALIIKSLFLQAFWIPTGSMEPTLVPGDRVIVAKVPYYFHDPRRGDIIVFEEPDPAKEPERGVVGALTHKHEDARQATLRSGAERPRASTQCGVGLASANCTFRF